VTDESKVKVSMFLEPALADALKKRTAKQGSGISKIMRDVFLCAHCQEPISDEFIIGSPKLIATDKYGVFFHRHREECLKASGTKIVYIPLCPKCKEPVYREFDRTDLHDRLQKRSVGFYCIHCDTQWNATLEEERDLARLLAR
jgi:hypothetical protein